MKQDELRALATCACCGRKIGQTGSPFFFKVTSQRFMVDMGAAQRQSGLEALIGSPAIARAMGTDEDLAKEVGEPRTVMVCDDCSCKENADMPSVLYAD